MTTLSALSIIIGLLFGLGVVTAASVKKLKDKVNSIETRLKKAGIPKHNKK